MRFSRGSDRPRLTMGSTGRILRSTSKRAASSAVRASARYEYGERNENQNSSGRRPAGAVSFAGVRSASGRGSTSGGGLVPVSSRSRASR